MNKQKKHFDTRIIHDCLCPEHWQGATLPPIYQCASHRHATAKNLSDTFGGRTDDHIYMRLTNPTNRTLEKKLASLEGGRGAVAMSSGMAAISNACLALLRTGDEFIAGKSLFMSTFCLFKNIFRRYGITPSFVESTDLTAIETAVNDKTRFIYLETIGNPKMDVPDLEASAEIAHRHGLPLLVDNTLASPWLCRPFDFGADIVIHSTTKYLSGHGDASGGIVIDRGDFNWDSEKFADFKPFIDRRGGLAYIDKVWREFHINFGTTMAPLHSYLTMVGLDTLAVRLERHQENSLKVANFLQDRPEVKWVNYPGLSDSPFRQTAVKQFRGKGFGAVLTFGLENKDACFKFIDNLEMIYHLANLGDCKSLVIHPSSTQYLSFANETKQELAITDDLIRLSVGIEKVEDICADIAQALDAI
ncbi:MAG: aminotransferase class I/II-fold pyridoxal phosphate-dependent enzyme [Desulfobia sp.]